MEVWVLRLASEWSFLDWLLFGATYLFFAGVAAVLAERKGRSGIEFFAIALFLTPLAGIVGALVAEPNWKRAEDKRLKSGRERKCPHCAEFVKREANTCRFCGRDMPREEPPASPPSPPKQFRTQEEYETWKRKSRTDKPPEQTS